MSLIQASETDEEAHMLAQWFDAQWASLLNSPAAKDELLALLDGLARHRDPATPYALVLHHLLAAPG